MHYENMSDSTLGQNEPNSNPNKPNSQKAKMSANFYFTANYENQPLRSLPQNKPNSKPNGPNRETAPKMPKRVDYW